MSIENVATRMMDLSKTTQSLKAMCFQNFKFVYEKLNEVITNQATLTKKADSSLELAIELSEKMDLQNLQMERQSAMIQELLRTVEAQNNIIISLQNYQNRL